MLISSPYSLYLYSIFFTFLSYIAPSSYAIPIILNKSPLSGVNSKSIISSSHPKYLIGSSPGIALLSSSAIPSISSAFKNFLSTPSSAIEHIIPFDSCPRIVPAFISPPGSFAPGIATITLIPFLAFGAPQTICNTSFPILTLQTCR